MPKKFKWGGKREKQLIYKHHEKWAKENGYRDNKWQKVVGGKMFMLKKLNLK
tara:strand:- start:3 stop:158 length:156 start_codon:yes stop_codon:yes gene_type:complete